MKNPDFPTKADIQIDTWEATAAIKFLYQPRNSSSPILFLGMKFNLNLYLCDTSFSS